MERDTGRIRTTVIYMRYVPLLLCLGFPAHAWDVSVVGPVCRLSHATDEAEVTVRHDPRAALPYAITIRRTSSVWEDAETFLMRFDGPAHLTIATDRHQLSDKGARLEVADSGFGNVLAGLALNQMAVAMLGEQALIIPLFGAGEGVAAFQDCVASAKT